MVLFLFLCNVFTVHCVFTVFLFCVLFGQFGYSLAAGRSGLAVTCLTAVWEDRGSNPTVRRCTFIVNITTTYSLGHGLCTLTAVPRSTQPSTLRGTVKWVSAFGLRNNNKWWWWVWFLAAYRRTHSPGRLAWSEGQRPLGAMPYSSHEPDALTVAELRWQHHKYCHCCRYIAITTFSIIAVIAAFCRISPSTLNRFKPNLQA